MSVAVLLSVSRRLTATSWATTALRRPLARARKLNISARAAPLGQARKFASESPCRTASSSVESASGDSETVAGDSTLKEQIDFSVVTPLSFASELRVYESSTDLLDLAQTSRNQALAGSILGVCGFMGVIAGSPTMPFSLHAFLLAGAALNTYKHVVITRGEMVKIGLRHVEAIIVLPTRCAAETNESCSGPTEDVGHDMTRRLKAAPELDVVLQMACVDVHLHLVEPASAWQGSKYSGLVADGRSSFKDLCSWLYIEEVSAIGRVDRPKSQNTDLLDALLASDKVIAAYKSELRKTVVNTVLEPPPSAVADFDKFLDKVPVKGEWFTSVVSTKKDLEQVGKRSVFSGVVLMMAGFIYVGRWIKGEGNTLPGSPNARTDASGAELIAKWAEKLAELRG